MVDWALASAVSDYLPNQGSSILGTLEISASAPSSDLVPSYSSSGGAGMITELVVWLSVWAVAGLWDSEEVGSKGFRNGHSTEHCARDSSEPSVGGTCL